MQTMELTDREAAAVLRMRSEEALKDAQFAYATLVLDVAYNFFKWRRINGRSDEMTIQEFVNDYKVSWRHNVLCVTTDTLYEHVRTVICSILKIAEEIGPSIAEDYIMSRIES